MGRCIELVYTPMRKDGTRGNPKSIKSDVVNPGKLTDVVSTVLCSLEDQFVNHVQQIELHLTRRLVFMYLKYFSKSKQKT